MQDLYQGWAENLVDEMAREGVNRTQLAALVDVHPSTITRILAGTICPNDELKWKIAGALHVRMDQLWAWPKIVPPAPTHQAA